MLSKRKMEEMCLTHASGESPQAYRLGIRSELAHAMEIPTRALRMWTAQRLDDVRRGFAQHPVGDVREFYAGRRWALMAIRRGK